MEGYVKVSEAGDHVVLALSRDELLLLAGSVNEALEAVEDWEFETRLGAGKDAARQVRNDLQAVIAGLPASP